MITMRKLTEDDVTFTITCENEDIPIKGNAMASGNDKEDKEVEDQIIRDLMSGNQWAWCCVKVTAEWNGFRGVDYLGCCSYKDEEDFKEGGYYEQMKTQALDDLNSSLQKIYDSLRPIL